MPWGLKQGHFYSNLRDINNYVSLKMNSVMEINFMKFIEIVK